MKNSIIGKWNQNKYSILSKIGRGGLGTIYKVCDKDDNIFALKISDNMYSISREYEVMNNLKNLDFIPTIYDMDDIDINQKTYFFIVMDYIDGVSLREYATMNNNITEKNAISIWLVLIKYLKQMFTKKYMYYDIKPDNILIDKKNNKIMIIDFGSVVTLDRSATEFTPAYNMSSWCSNSKVSKEQILIFNTTMLIIYLFTGKELNPLKFDFNDLIVIVKKIKINKIVNDFIIKSLKCRYKNIKIFEKELKIVYNSVINNKYLHYRIIDILFTTSLSIFLFFLLYCMLK